MVNYGSNERFILKITNIDYEAEIAGVKVMHIPAVISLSSIPLWFNFLSLTVILLFSLIVFSLWSSGREAEGRPVTLNACLVQLVSRLPSILRSGIFPSIASINPYCKKYRR